MNCHVREYQQNFNYLRNASNGCNYFGKTEPFEKSVTINYLPFASYAKVSNQHAINIIFSVKNMSSATDINGFIK